MNAVVIIPARMASTRFPGKPLVDIAGKPMVQWVYERASRARGISRVIVATCDLEIVSAVEAFGGEAVMTSDKHRSGTDRLAEVAATMLSLSKQSLSKHDAEIIVNVQGDEPLIDPVSIERAVEPFSGGDEVMTSLMVAIDRKAAQDPNLVKVVVSLDNHALYFSRAAIPYLRDQEAIPNSQLPIPNWFGHVGLYAYTRQFLLKFASLEPTPLEEAESLEQLRVLEHGYRIKMVEVTERPMGVDTPDDLERVRREVTDSITCHSSLSSE